MTPTPEVAVLIPAHNEEELVGACLRSVRAALLPYQAAGGQTLVVLVAHRCSDRTAERARAALAGTSHLVLVDDQASTVANVRRRAAAAALAVFPAQRQLWLLCTDADSVVPPTWVHDVLGHAQQAVAVAGLVELDGMVSAVARDRHDALVADLVTDTWHGHTYGANLAVRADAYVRVGGFPLVAVGEDTALIDAVQSAGLVVARDPAIVVRTSGRLVGRADGGLADLLSTLTVDEFVLADPVRG